MKLDLPTLCANIDTVSPGGSSSWGTALGQGVGHKISFTDMDEFLPSLLYRQIADLNKVKIPLGKGGHLTKYAETGVDFGIIQAALYEKVFVNGKLIVGGHYILLISKEYSSVHAGRFTLKYGTNIEYNGVKINEDCINRLPTTLGIAPNAGWFINDIDVKNQDELHFTAYVVDPTGPVSFPDQATRKRALMALLPASKPATSKGSGSFDTSDRQKFPYQLILFGAPGTGKSHFIDDCVPQAYQIRTTFHPDSDYASFVGSYKPVMTDVSVSGGPAPTTKKELSYKFVAQAFTRAYVRAWSAPTEPVFLIIEEINRGNCAQIFGDIFQLLDRDASGKSVYPVDADDDLRQYLEEEFKGISISDIDIKFGNKLALPPNLFVWATMNTSDQSLFPIDSAFKRRWIWKYIAIKDEAKGHFFTINGKPHDWWKFIEYVNGKINTITSSADKQMGYWFAIPDVSATEISSSQFVSKVLFYLWNDVYKDYTENPDSIFRKGNSSGDDLSFASFYKGDQVDESIVDDFLAFNGV